MFPRSEDSIMGSAPCSGLPAPLRTEKPNRERRTGNGERRTENREPEKEKGILIKDAFLLIIFPLVPSVA